MKEIRDPAIPQHTVEQYRERVVEDAERRQRSDGQIRYVIGKAFRNACVPEMIYQETNVLVSFVNPETNTSLGAYYLIVDIDKKIAEGGLVTKTIKTAERIWEMGKTFDTRRRWRKKRRAQQRREDREEEFV